MCLLQAKRKEWLECRCGENLRQRIMLLPPLAEVEMPSSRKLECRNVLSEAKSKGLQLDRAAYIDRYVNVIEFE